VERVSPIRRFGIACAALCAFAAGITAAYAALHPTVAVIDETDSILRNAMSAENSNRIVRLRGTLQTVAPNQTSVSVDIADPYGAGRRTLSVFLNNTGAAHSLSPGQTVLVDFLRAPGPLRAEDATLVNVL